MNTHKCEWCGFTEDVLNPSDDKKTQVHIIRSALLKEDELHLCYRCLLKSTLYPESNREHVVRRVLANKVLQKIL